MATNESHCEIPVFVHVMEHTRNIYLGVSQTPSIRTSFDIVHLHHTPNTLKSIPGLLEMFKGKIAMQYQDPVTISLRMKNTYAKSHKKTTLEDFHWQSEILDFTDSHHRFGVSIDPIVEVKLFSVWPEVAENVCSDVICHDNEINLEFLRSMEIKFEDSPLCYLTDILNEYIQCSESRRSLVECVGSQAMSMMEGGNPLDLLTESKIPKLTLGLSEIKLLKKGIHSFDGPLKDGQLQEMLYYMFPDADTVKPNLYKIPDAEPFDPLKIKAAFEDSLIHRLSKFPFSKCF
jgi:Rab3 GTPase-activating protein catalytic subunit